MKRLLDDLRLNVLVLVAAGRGSLSRADLEPLELPDQVIVRRKRDGR